MRPDDEPATAAVGDGLDVAVEADAAGERGRRRPSATVEIGHGNEAAHVRGRSVVSDLFQPGPVLDAAGILRQADRAVPVEIRCNVREKRIGPVHVAGADGGRRIETESEAAGQIGQREVARDVAERRRFVEGEPAVTGVERQVAG